MSGTTEEELRALQNIGEQVVDKARAAGADVAEAVVREGSHLSVKVRMREPELVEEAGSRSLGLRVMLGQQVAVTYTSDLGPDGVARLVEDAVELAKLSEPDPFAGPPEASLLSSASQHVDLDTFDDKVGEIDGATALRWALEAEAAALDADKRVSNSEGATFTRAVGGSALVTSGGFRGVSRGSYASIVVSPVAAADDDDGKKRSGHHWSARRHLDELDAPAEVGLEAAKKTLAKIGASKIPSQELPIIFDPDAGRAILGLLSGCISGGAIWRRSSYLLDRLGSRVASDLVTVVDDPLIPRASGSRAYDGEGLLSRENVIVEKGMLQSYLLDSYSGRKLEQPSSASASRGASGGVGVSTSNFILRPGELTPEALLKDTPSGLYVTNMMGFGFNGVTGDFSRGASGFLIEGGELARPVSEVTISLNLDQLLQRIDAVADDLDLRTATAVPTFRVSSMTLAGT